MANIEYCTEKELEQFIAQLYQDDTSLHERVRDLNVLFCFAVRLDKHDQLVPGKGEPVKLKKIGPEIRLFLPDESYYVCVIDRYFWEKADDIKRKGYICQVLNRLTCERTEKGMKIKTLPYDVQINLATLKKYGFFSENLKILANTMDEIKQKMLSATKNALEKMQKNQDNSEKTVKNTSQKIAEKSENNSLKNHPGAVHKKIKSAQVADTEEEMDIFEEEVPRVKACPLEM